MRMIKIILATTISAVLLVAIAGHIKFNILEDDIYIQQEDGSVIKYNDLTKGRGDEK